MNKATDPKELVERWSCDERDRADCRNAHGCHCREITALASRIQELEAERDGALAEAQSCRERALERTVRAQSAEALVLRLREGLEKIRDYGDKYSGAEAQHLGLIARNALATPADEGGEGSSNASPAATRDHSLAATEAAPSAAIHAPDCQSHIVDVRGRPDDCTCGAGNR